MPSSMALLSARLKEVRRPLLALQMLGSRLPVSATSKSAHGEFVILLDWPNLKNRPDVIIVVVVIFTTQSPTIR